MAVGGSTLVAIARATFERICLSSPCPEIKRYSNVPNTSDWYWA